ncbi:MAG: sigma factor, ECF subfamily protein, partial [Bacteroidota bacterium]
LGHSAMNQAVETEMFSVYHYEAAIASEHLKAKTYEDTNWDQILIWYEQLQKISPSVFTQLNIAAIHIQRSSFQQAEDYLKSIDPQKLEQRAYLYYATYADLLKYQGDFNGARKELDHAIDLCSNEVEKQYLLKKRSYLKDS